MLRIYFFKSFKIPSIVIISPAEALSGYIDVTFARLQVVNTNSFCDDFGVKQFDWFIMLFEQLVVGGEAKIKLL